jgi:hypothetical protein
VRHLLVFPERDSAEEAAEAAAEWFPALGVPTVVRELLAGEDDVDDAQWVVVVDDPDDALQPADLARLDALAEEGEGWREPG